MFVRRSGNYWSPWREMHRVRRDMNRLFADSAGNLGQGSVPAYPAMNAWANENGVIVTAELPGVSVEEIDISVVGDTLTLTGNREPDEPQDGKTYHRRERRHGRFARSFRLPFDIEGNKVEAALENGVLQISLPRAEADKPRKITVKAS
jgi:HSP20 family protein